MSEDEDDNEKIDGKAEDKKAKIKEQPPPEDDGAEWMV